MTRRSVFLVVVTVLSLSVVGYSAVTYLGFDPSASRVGIRADVPWHHSLLMVHIITGMVALGLGPWQFVRRIRRIRPLHRWIGRAYLFAGVFPSALSGIVVGVLTTVGPWAAAGFVVGDAAWALTAVLAYRAARQHRYAEHARFMVRNFALTCAAITFRIWLPLMILALLPLLGGTFRGDFGALFDTAYSITCWLAFLPNMFAVMLVQRSGARGQVLGRASRSIPATTRAPEPTSTSSHSPSA